MYGYRVGEVNISGELEVKTSFKVELNHLAFVHTERRAAGVLHGPGFSGILMPKPDQFDLVSKLLGASKRAGCKVPEAYEGFYVEFSEFCDRWNRQNLVPLSRDSDTSLENWLANTRYPEWRKQELREASKQRVSNRVFEVNAFIKEECYPDFKYPRGIYSRTDKYKTMVGPIFKLIEDVVYRHHSFIKHVPVADRPKYIMNMLFRPGAKYASSDYTSFEALFVQRLMYAGEFTMYSFMTQFLAEHEVWMSNVMKIADTNVIRWKEFTMALDATRMSGEMCTSLGNTYTNLMLFLFACEKLKIPDPIGVYEGDDSLNTTGDGRFPDQEFFANMGLKIKMEVHERLEEASFCGIIFDEHDKIGVADPLKILGHIWLLPSKYATAGKRKKDALLRAKALSFAHQYPGAPVISDYAHMILRLTSHISNRDMVKAASHSYNHWWYCKFLDVLDTKLKRIEPPTRTRLLVERLFHVPLADQYRLEKMFQEKMDMDPFNGRLIDAYVPASWIHFYENYVGRYPMQREINLNQLCTIQEILTTSGRCTRNAI